MGSSSKKHKKEKDRDTSKKHKHKSRSRSPAYSPETRDTRSTRHRHRTSPSAGGARSPNGRDSYDARIRDRENREKRSTTASSAHQRHHHHHKRHKEHKSKNRNRSPERITGRIVIDDYHSDSSDVVEVPIAPPAPVISREPPPNIRKEKTRSPSPIPENGAGDSLSIDETNRLRAKLGLKPLEVESTVAIKEAPGKKNEHGLKSFKDEWGEFLHKPAANIAEKKQAEKIRDKIKQRKEKRALEEKLKRMKGLGESDDEGDDISKWLERSKKKEDSRREADRRAKLLEEMDAEFGVGSLVDQEARRAKNSAYRDRDLKGLRVDHDVDEFTEGRTIILTLKDQEVLNEDGDALVNVNLLDDQRYKKNVENRKQKPNTYGYNVYEETVDEFGNPIDRSILEKYDEEVGSMKKKSFTIGENIEEQRAHQRKLLEIKTKLAGKRLESLDVETLKLASDTYTETELEKFKKPKKKVKKLRQKFKAEDLLPLPGQKKIQSDFGRRPGRQRSTTQSLMQTDDTPDMPTDMSHVKIEDEVEEDLERVLSKARKLKQKESIIRKAVIDPTEMKAEVKSEDDSDDEMNEMKDGHITLNATAEFCRTLGDIPTYGMAGNRDEASNDMMDFEHETLEPELPIEEPMPSTGTWNSVNPDAIVRAMPEDISNEISDIAILDEEPDVGAGVAAALRVAVSKGYLEKEDMNRPSNTRMAHLQAKNYSIEDKAYGEEDKFGRRDRYHSGPIMDFREKETFKPNVKLEYIDDNGRVLNAKEAFRYLSHKFHGKGPGKNKIEKRLKKSEQDGLMMKMSSTDTPLGTLSMLQQKQKETQTAYVVLSGSKQNHASTSISKHK